MAKTVDPRQGGFRRATKWILALLIITYVGWLSGLGPKSYRPAQSYVIPAYFSNPDPDCRASPTPECLAEMAEQSIYDIYDHFGNFPFEAEFVGMLHARLGNFDRADQLAEWLEEHRIWETLDDGYEGPVTPYYDSKVEYLLGVGKWREALAIVTEFGGARIGTNCYDLRSIALGRAVEGERDEALEILAQMAKSECGKGDDSSLDRPEFLSVTRRTVDLLLLLHLPRDQTERNDEYEEALWEWLSAPGGSLIFWKTPPAFVDYCDVLASIDHNARLEAWQLRTLLVDLLNAGAMARAKEVLEKIISRPSEKKWLLDWLQDRIGSGFFVPGTTIRFIADNYLTDDERRLIAPRVAEEASRLLDEEMIEWAHSYLSAMEYEDAKYEIKRQWQSDMAVTYRLMRIQKDHRHDFSKSTKALKALSEEYTWRWYHVPLPNFSTRWFKNYDQRTGIVTELFRYGEYEDGFKLIQELAYQPGALTAAAWGLKYEGPEWCGSPK